jgi:hypothetical protein
MVVVSAPDRAARPEAATPSAAGARDGAAAPAGTAEARAPRRDPEAIRRSIEKLAASMDQRLAAEQHDASWSGVTEQTLRTAIAERAAGSKLLDVSCRKTLCRLLVRHASLTDKKAFSDSLDGVQALDVGTKVFRYGAGSPEAERETTVYFVREGYDLRGGLRSGGGPL